MCVSDLALWLRTSTRTHQMGSSAWEGFNHTIVEIRSFEECQKFL